MDLIEYARNELDIMCPPDENGRKEPMQEAIEKNIMDIVRMFADQGHSGMTASYVLGILGRVMKYKPLTPLTGADDEWRDVSFGKSQCEQNIRYCSVFRDNHDNSTAYDVSAKVFSNNGGRSWYTSIESRVPITFPYTVPDKPIYVILDGGAEDGKTS